MGHPRNSRSGHNLNVTSLDLPPHAPPGDDDGGGASLPTPPAPPGNDTGGNRGHGVTNTTDDLPVGTSRSHLHQEGPLMGRLGVTVMPFARDLGVSLSSSVSSTSSPRPSMSLATQVSSMPSGVLRGVEESLPPSRPLNYALHTEEDTGIPHKHPPSSPPPDTLHAASPSPHYLTATRALQQVGNQPFTHPNLEDLQRTPPPEDGDEGTKGTNTSTTASTSASTSTKSKHPTRDTTTTRDPTTSASTTTRDPRRWIGRTQRSAPSQKRLVQPPPHPTTVCNNDPCGDEPSCHIAEDKPKGFVCFCGDKTMVEPGSSCPSKILLERPPPNTLPKEMVPVNVVWPMGVASVLLVALMLLAFWRRKSLCAWMRHRHTEKKPSQQSQDTIPKSNSLVAYNFASNPNYYTEGPDTQTVHSLPVHLIHPRQISFIGELGEGCFGKVYKGTYAPCCRETIGEGGGGGGGNRRNHEDSAPRRGEEGEKEEEEEETQTVAVKVIKESVSAKGEDDFMREVEIMSAFSHPNILTLVGIVAKADDTVPWMVFEFMPFGDLAELLRSCGPHFYSNHTPVTSLSTSDLLRISVQIASGMEYLSSQHFVHRDLACRNCLVGENLTVKISDFGMSRDVYTCDYYKVGGSRMLPVRWMAPESIMYGKFTLESDVWSFGVVLWEIYSFGKQPYYGNSNENVVKLIFQGILLCPPDTCPPRVCDVMRKCWATDPTDRLKFPEILCHLKELRGEAKGAPTCLPPPFSPCGSPVTYSQLCLQEEAAGHLDRDLYMVPRRVDRREYLTVLNEV